MALFGIDIGTLAFFAFSFLAGVVIASQAVFGSREETTKHRAVKGAVGAAYAIIAAAAFMQLEGVHSPYVDTGAGGQPTQQTPAQTPAQAPAQDGQINQGNY